MCGLGVCGAGGGRPREPVLPALAARAGPRRGHAASKRPLFGKRSAAGSRLSGRAEGPRPWEGASGSAAGTGAGTGAALPTRGAARARELVGAPCPELLVSAARRYCPTRGAGGRRNRRGLQF